MLWERGSSESVKIGRAELEAASALEFGGLELLPWHEPSWQRAPSPGRQGRANTELVLCTVPGLVGAGRGLWGHWAVPAQVCVGCQTLLALPGLGCCLLCWQSKQM